jgi:hypothetical protein
MPAGEDQNWQRNVQTGWMLRTLGERKSRPREDEYVRVCAAGTHTASRAIAGRFVRPHRRCGRGGGVCALGLGADTGRSIRG